MYFHRVGHDRKDCWKMKRERLVCTYCGKKETDCWTKQRKNRESQRTEHHQIHMLQEEKAQEDFSAPQMVAAVHLERDGKPLPKHRSFRNEDYNRDVMQIKNLDVPTGLKGTRAGKKKGGGKKTTINLKNFWSQSIIGSN